MDSASTNSWRSSPNFALAVVGLSQFVDYFVYGLVIPIIPVFAIQELGISYFEVSFLFAAYASGLIIFTPITGSLSDRIGRKYPMLFGTIGLALSTLLFAFSKTYIGLLFARFAQGASAAVTFTVGNALLADVFPPSVLSEKMGIANSLVGLGELSGPVAGGFMYKWMEYKFPFFFCAGLAGLDVIGRLFLKTREAGSSKFEEIEESPETRNSGVEEDRSTDLEIGEKSSEIAPINSAENLEKSELLNTSAEGEKKEGNPIGRIPTTREIIFDPKMLAMTFTVSFGSLTLTMSEPVFPDFLESRYGIGSDVVGLVFMTMALFYTLASPIVGKLQTKFSGTILCSCGFLVMGACLPLSTLCPHLWMVFALFALFGVCTAFMIVPSLTDMSARADELGAQGTAYGIVYSSWNVAFALGMFCGPVLSGGLTDFFEIFWAMVGIGSLLVLFGFVFLSVMQLRRV